MEAKKRRSSILDRIKLTPEESERLRQKRIESIKSTSVDYQLGVYVGEEIAARYLPTLEIDMLQSRKVINVLPEEKEEADRLEKEWWSKQEAKENSDEEWKKLRAYHEIIEKKYLPDTLVCHIRPIHVNSEEDFKAGVANAIWNCDYSHYSCSGPADIEYELEEDGFFTKFTLKRSI